MITSLEIEQPRSPRSLREFVTQLKESVRSDEHERHLGIQKKGLYKEYLDELVPLSCFAVLAYPECYTVKPILGNQGYDALVFDQTGKEFDRIEITSPHNGAAAATEAKFVVNHGWARMPGGEPGDDFDAQFPHVLATCYKKAAADYSDCTLVIAVAPMPPFESFEGRYEEQIVALRREIAQIKFKAKRVFLLLLPDRVINVHG